ncbi:MAG: hypothetical protein U9N02_04570, partial [Campylobacterota bacterium]|nr:hypothetical protein [Campylobacterota bacterium]
EINFDNEFSNDYEQIKLLEELKLVKINLKELNKKVQKDKHSLEDEAANQTKEKNRQRTILYKVKEELETKQKSYIQNKNQSEIDFKNAKQVAKEEKEKKISELNSNYISLEKSIEINNERVDELAKIIESVSVDINTQVNSEIEIYKNKIREFESSKNIKIKKIEEKYKKDKQNNEAEKLEVLTSQGVDEKLLNELVSKKEKLTNKLNDIDKYRAYVAVYISEYQDAIKTIPLKEDELIVNESELKEIEKNLKSLELNYKNVDTKISENIDELKTIKNNLNNFLKKYTQRIENEKIQKSIKNSLILNFNENIDDDKIDYEIIDTLFNIYEKIKSNESKIKSLVLESLKNLKYNNIFKIDIPTDFIEDVQYTKTAKELVEYIAKNKLAPLKEASSEQFKGEIRKIKKELDSFEEAILDIHGQIKSLANGIRKAVESFNVIDSIEIRPEDTNNNLLYSLKSLSTFYDDNSESFLSGLFNENIQESKKVKNELDNKILELVDLLNTSKEYLELEDGFVLEFKIIEKGNNLKWRQNIDDIGSNGTSTLVKSIINISMLQMVSKNIVKNNQITSHCILDEIGTISTDYFRELKEFVNHSGFVFLNGMPIEDDMLISMYPTIYVGQNYGNYSKMILASKMEI